MLSAEVKEGEGMTDEFAINILEQYREKPTLINEIETVEEAVWLDEALDMSIKALKQKPTDDATLKDIFCMGCEYKEQEPKTGRWIKENPFLLSKCSECGNNAFGYHGFDEIITDFCPNCGCRMVKPQESEVNNG